MQYLYLMGIYRPFHIIKKPDGRPAVEVDNDGKKQQFVSTQYMTGSNLLKCSTVCGRTVVNGPR